MSACPRLDEFRDLAAAPSSEQTTHLLACSACRAALGAQLVATLPTDGGGGAADELAPVPLEPPGRFERQRDERGEPVVLGRGGFARVVLARDTLLGRDLALKALRSRQLEPKRRAVAERRLLQEARVVGQLEHPSIVPLYDLVRTADGQLVTVMRRIRGRTLAEAIRACATLDERLRLLPHVLAACNAVAYAHARGVLHRDLKPENVMVDRFGETLVIDWGLARATSFAEDELGDDGEAGRGDHGEAVRLVSDETLGDGRGGLGTPAYMSPEQLAGARDLIDERSDVWGLGAILFTVLTGEAPRFKSRPTAPPPPVRALEPSLPPDLAAICDKALAEARDARYPSAESLAADLDAWLHGQRVTAHAYRPLELLWRFVRANRAAAAITLGAAVLLFAVAVVAAVRVREERDQARRFATTLAGEVLQLVPLDATGRTRERLTASVTAWLLEHPERGDLSDAAWAWSQLSRQYLRADRADEAIVPTERCLALVAQHAGPRTPRLEAAEANCALTRYWSPGGAASPERQAELERLVLARSNPLPSDPAVLEVYARLASILAERSREAGEREASLRWAALSLELATSCTRVDPASVACWHRLAEANIDHAYLALDQRDGPGAVRGAEAQLAAARRAFEVDRDPEGATGLVRAIIGLLVIDQYAPGLLDPARAAGLVAEGHRFLDAALLFEPMRGETARMRVDLHLLEGRPREAFAAGRALERSEHFDSFGPTGWAALFSGEAAWLREVLVREFPADTSYDAWALRALAHAELGRHAEAAEAARQAAAQSFTTAALPGSLTAWAAGQRDDLAQARRALVEALVFAGLNGREEVGDAAWETFAVTLAGAK